MAAEVALRGSRSAPSLGPNAELRSAPTRRLNRSHRALARACSPHASIPTRRVCPYRSPPSDPSAPRRPLLSTARGPPTSGSAIHRTRVDHPSQRSAIPAAPAEATPRTMSTELAYPRSSFRQIAAAFDQARTRAPRISRPLEPCLHVIFGVCACLRPREDTSTASFAPAWAMPARYFAGSCLPLSSWERENTLDC